MFLSLKNKISRNLINLPGWHTKRKIVVIESDDWGSIRMPSREVYDILLKKGYPVDKCTYNRNDSLESNDDLEKLFEVLTSVKDSKGTYPVLTANNIVANPDFDKIKDSKFNQYYYEPFTETLKKYPLHDKVLSLYKEGIKNKIFFHQFHGREHVNVFTWMNALKNKDKTSREIFDYNMFTTHTLTKSNCRKEYLDSFGTHNEYEIKEIRRNITEGLALFEKLWGYKSKSFIATCYIWHPKVEEYLKEDKIIHIQSGRVQKIPLLNSNGTYKIKRLYTGKRNKLEQVYTVRNVIFEPSEDPNKDWIDSALNDIKNAFQWNKPAIISAHRVNFIGSINEKNRTNNLRLFRDLLQKIIKLYPDVIFMSSPSLGRLILN